MVSITIFAFISLKVRENLNYNRTLNDHMTYVFFLQIFPIMVEVINIYGVLGLYAGISFAGVAVITFIVPETKGKNLISPQSV